MTHENGFTTWQYAVWRVVAALALGVRLVAFEPALWLRLGAAACAVLLVVGLFDRLAALGLAALWSLVAARYRLDHHPWLVMPALLLVRHAAVAPGRGLAALTWRLPPWAAVGTGAVTALGYALTGAVTLWRATQSGPLVPGFVFEASQRALVLTAAALALAGALAFTRASLRPWSWLAWLAAQVLLAVTLRFADFSLALALLHLATLDPRWLPARGTGVDTIYYDGSCGVCHALVRFVLSEDLAGHFRFAPLQGESFAHTVDAAVRSRLPDSVVLRTASGELLLRSAAVLHLLSRLGGLWTALASVGRRLPRGPLDRAYDDFAAIRSRLARRPKDSCPLMPAPLRARFDP